jgi:hypothetical protein
MNLTAENVEKIARHCFFKKEEKIENPVFGDGIAGRSWFHPERLEESREMIEKMLSELPDSFKKSGGGGMSFLMMCQDKNDRQWADLHWTMDALVMLGNAIEKVRFIMPREMWKSFPGGMPYVIIDDTV